MWDIVHSERYTIPPHNLNFQITIICIMDLYIHMPHMSLAWFFVNSMYVGYEQFEIKNQ